MNISSYSSAKKIKISEASSSLILKFDIDGNLSERNYKDIAESKCDKYLYLFNNNILTKKTFKCNSGSLENKFEFIFDSLGNQIECLQYDSMERFQSKTKSTFDGRGNEISKCNYDFFGQLFCKQQYIYDSTGNCIETIEYNEIGKINSITTCRFDDNRNEIERSYNMPGKMHYIIKYKYMKYDKYKIWTRRLSETIDFSDKGKIIDREITIREITYY